MQEMKIYYGGFQELKIDRCMHIMAVINLSAAQGIYCLEWYACLLRNIIMLMKTLYGTIKKENLIQSKQMNELLPVMILLASGILLTGPCNGAIFSSVPYIFHQNINFCMFNFVEWG